MKNYNETINSVFDRINEYEVEKRRKRKIVTRTVTSLCCCCLVALLGVGVWQSGLLNTTPPTVLSDSSNVGNPTNSTSQATNENEKKPTNQSQQNSTALNGDEISSSTNSDNTITPFCYINQISGIANGAQLYLDPTKHYTDIWNNQKVAEYFNIDLSNIGKEFNYTGDAKHTVTYSNEDVLVRDLVGLSYTYLENEFVISVSKLSPPYDCVYSLEESKTTRIETNNGTVDVLFAGTSGGVDPSTNQSRLVADFKWNNVYYRVTAENISTKHFYEIIENIVIE